MNRAQRRLMAKNRQHVVSLNKQQEDALIKEMTKSKNQADISLVGHIVLYLREGVKKKWLQIK